MIETGAPTVLYTSADFDGQGGALRCLMDMGNEIGAWGYRPMLALSDRQQGGPAQANGALPTFRLSLPRPQRGRSAADYVRDVLETARSARRLARLIRRQHVALVHVNEILDVYGGLAAKIAGVPCVWHVRADISGWPRPLRAVLPRIVSALSSEIVVVSESVRRLVFADHGLDTRKVSVIHDPGPDPETFRPGVDGAAVRRGLGIDDDAPVVVLVAKMVEPKGHEVLLRAAPEVLESHPTARFVIVGGDLDGEHHRRYANRMRSLPAELGAGHAVMFTGYRSDVAQIMAAADIVTHCSTHPDPFPGTVLQGMALGKAVIASDLGGPSEQIEAGRSGVLVPAADPAALASAIRSLLDDPGRRASLGRAAAERVRTTFTAEDFYRRLAGSYAHAIGGRRW